MNSTLQAASVYRIPHAWYVAALTAEVPAEGVLARTVHGLPLVLFRTADGRVGALEDRCPHRNVPLSLGKVRGASLECAYHGWCFDRGGACTKVPGRVDGAGDGDGLAAAAVPVREAQGLIWVWPEVGASPPREPFTLAHLEDPAYAVDAVRLEVAASVHAVAENALDVPHTSFLHAGLFRTGRRNRIEAIVRRGADRVEAEYVGEPAPTGLAGRVLAPGGGVVQHWDRFILPSIAQIEYRLGQAHLLATTLLTPVSAFETVMFAVVAAKLPLLPHVALKAGLRPVLLRIFRQDAAILKAQTRNLERFGEEAYRSTELDLLGPSIQALLRRAERAWPEGGDTSERRVRLEV
jgi:phenylpropionate dioxygenase-like ring-hydroxylating dioxygenase large terminal subunit